MAYYPHSELVARAWVLSIPGMLASAGTTLPGDVASWAERGFYQLSIVGGRKDRDIPQHQPLVQVDAFAVNLGSGRPPWGRANQMCELVAAHCWNGIDAVNPSQRIVSLPAAYQDARVQTVEVVTEPRRMEGDESRIAHYSMDVVMTWVAVTS